MAGIDRGDLWAEFSGAPNSRRVRLERWLPAPVGEVWAAITESGRIGEWFTPAVVDPQLNGRIELRTHDGSPMMTGKVREFRPPEVLEYYWVDDRQTSVVRFELVPENDGTRLTLTEYFLADQNAGSRAGGWQMYLERLSLYLKGRPYPLDKPRYRSLKQAYEEVLRQET